MAFEGVWVFWRFFMFFVFVFFVFGGVFWFSFVFCLCFSSCLDLISNSGICCLLVFGVDFTQ